MLSERVVNNIAAAVKVALAVACSSVKGLKMFRFVLVKACPVEVSKTEGAKIPRPVTVLATDAASEMLTPKTAPAPLAAKGDWAKAASPNTQPPYYAASNEN